jgi:hypothetical protein
MSKSREFVLLGYPVCARTSPKRTTRPTHIVRLETRSAQLLARNDPSDHGVPIFVPGRNQMQ